MALLLCVMMPFLISLTDLGIQFAIDYKTLNFKHWANRFV